MGEMRCNHIVQVALIEAIKAEAEIVEIGMQFPFWPEQVGSIEQRVETNDHVRNISLR